jgi:hypothetical protein
MNILSKLSSGPVVGRRPVLGITFGDGLGAKVGVLIGLGVGDGVFEGEALGVGVGVGVLDALGVGVAVNFGVVTGDFDGEGETECVLTATGVALGVS